MRSASHPSCQAERGRARMSAKRRLVIVGNGMGGARLVEDVITRGGGDLFDIAVFV